MSACTFLLVLLGAPAQASDPTDLPPELRDAVAAAAAGGAPVDRLESKAREGLAKGVPLERIASAVRQWGAEWVAARELVGSDDPDLVTASAAATRAGAGPDDVRALAGADPAVAAESLWTLVDLVNLGVAVDPAERLVQLATRSGQPLVALRLLPEATRESVARWGAAAPAHVEAALSSGSVDQLTDAPGRSGEAPGHGGEHSDNGNHYGHGGKP